MTTHEFTILYHENACRHDANSIKNCLENSGYEVLPHSPYNLDFLSFDFHLLLSMQNRLAGERFTIVEDTKIHYLQARG